LGQRCARRRADADAGDGAERAGRRRRGDRSNRGLQRHAAHAQAIVLQVRLRGRALRGGARNRCERQGATGAPLTSSTPFEMPAPMSSATL